MLQGENKGIAQALADYMDCLERQRGFVNKEYWRILFPKDVPRQTDNCSCGVYAIVFMECLARGFPLQQCGISAATAAAARARIMYLLQQAGA